MKTTIIFELVHRHDEYSDYETTIGDQLIRLTLVENGQPYLTIADEAETTTAVIG